MGGTGGGIAELLAEATKAKQEAQPLLHVHCACCGPLRGPMPCMPNSQRAAPAGCPRCIHCPRTHPKKTKNKKNTAPLTRLQQRRLPSLPIRRHQLHPRLADVADRHAAVQALQGVEGEGHLPPGAGSQRWVNKRRIRPAGGALPSQGDSVSRGVAAGVSSNISRLHACWETAAGGTSTAPTSSCTTINLGPRSRLEGSPTCSGDSVGPPAPLATEPGSSGTPPTGRAPTGRAATLQLLAPAAPAGRGRGMRKRAAHAQRRLPPAQTAGRVHGSAARRLSSTPSLKSAGCCKEEPHRARPLLPGSLPVHVCHPRSWLFTPRATHSNSSACGDATRPHWRHAGTLLLPAAVL